MRPDSSSARAFINQVQRWLYGTPKWYCLSHMDIGCEHVYYFKQQMRRQIRMEYQTRPIHFLLRLTYCTPRYRGVLLPPEPRSECKITEPGSEKALSSYVSKAILKKPSASGVRCDSKAKQSPAFARIEARFKRLLKVRSIDSTYMRLE
jgi:hypothetical protein